MKYYSVSVGCHSDYREVVLAHKETFTPSEFQKMCMSAYGVDVVPGEYIDVKFDTLGGGYFDKKPGPVDKLVEMFGFVRVEPLNCHIVDYGLIDKHAFVINGLNKRISKRYEKKLKPNGDFSHWLQTLDWESVEK